MSDEHRSALMTAPHDAPERMHPLVAVAMRQGIADPATLREMLALQRDWEAGEARKSFARALTALKRDLPTVIAKDGVVDYASAKGRTHYTHATLAGVMAAITEPLTRHGFSLSWVPATSERSVRVTCRLTHADGHVEECSLDAPPDTSGSKSSAQAIASTITLLSRYTALALLGIATADMKEPTGEPPPPAPETIDTARNLRVAKKLADVGVKREEVEARIGRKVSEWTASDIEAIGALVAERKAARERGEDPDA
jgi:hypothetical protein